MVDSDSFLLTEDGDFLLTEDGKRILLEEATAAAAQNTRSVLSVLTGLRGITATGAASLASSTGAASLASSTGAASLASSTVGRRGRMTVH